jgi:exopolysaccharide biosynthesis polyprenyl glycosylphosphotransferase
MASDLQPTSYLNLASATTFGPQDRTALSSSMEAAGTILDSPSIAAPPIGSPSIGRTIITPEPSTLERAFGVVADTAETPEPAADRSTGNRILRTRLFVIDLIGAVFCWAWLGYVLTDAKTVPGRVLPGIAGAAATLIAMRATGLYRSRLCVRRADELWRIFAANLWGAVAFVIVEWQLAMPGTEFLACGAACIALVGASRWQYGRWLRARRARGQYLRDVILVGANDDAAQLRTMLRSEPELGYSVAAVVGNNHDDPAWSDIPHSASMTSIPTLAASTGASGILVVPYALSSDTMQRAIMIAANANLHVQVWPGFRGVGSPRLRHVPVSGEAFFYVEPRRNPPWQLAVKRAIDIAVAGTVLALTSPIIGLAALLIKLEDRGPVFHKGDRVGMHGKVFKALKLRSMYVANPAAADAAAADPAALAAINERTDGPLFKVSNDPRVTKVGRFIRASSIDELPQLWNVLCGTMSLVGPRPALPNEAAQFDSDLQRRHSVRPGVTGLWQVEARHNPSFNAYRRLDLRYVDNWSLYLDISILFSTIPSVFSQAIHAFSRSKRQG